MAMGTRRSYRAVMKLRKSSGEAMVAMVSPALADAPDGHVAVVEDTAEDALIDVDAFDLVEAHLEGAPLDEPGLVDDPQIGDVGLGGPAVEPGLHGPVQRHDRHHRRGRQAQQNDALGGGVRATERGGTAATIQAAIAGQ